MTLVKHALNMIKKSGMDKLQAAKNEAIAIKSVFNHQGVLAALGATVTSIISYVYKEILTSQGSISRAQQARMDARMQRELTKIAVVAVPLDPAADPQSALPTATSVVEIITHQRNLLRQQPSQRHIMADDLTLMQRLPRFPGRA